MKGRHTFICIHCGLKLAGRQLASGQIVPYDRAPSNALPPEPCVCASCLQDTQSRNI